VCPDVLDPSYHKASCGFGLIAHRHGEASHWLVEAGIRALSRLSHRGAVASDGKTGDGCGLLFALPKAFLSQAAHAAGIELAEHYAVGHLFVSPNPEMEAASRQVLCERLGWQGLSIAGTRDVPVVPDACGEQARQSLPKVAQIFINRPEGWDEALFERRLYVARMQTEHLLETVNPDFYVASLSARTIVYKGMVTPENLPVFYPDLRDPTFQSSLCMFHQRFSTNTWPKWRLAQPFRLLAHNGEINTINANRQWAFTRRQRFLSPVLPELPSLHPLVSQEGSDSQSLDNLLEVLTAGGVPLLKAIRLMIPPAWQKDPELPSDVKAFYDYYSPFIEPWDGPAGLVLTDGELAACILDRNGLRPVRYQLTADDHLIIASETGVLDHDPAELIAKGLLGPGEMLVLDTRTGQLRFNADIERELAAEHPFGEWTAAHRLRLPDTPACDSLEALPENRLPAEKLQTYQKLFGLTLEEQEQILWPMATDAQEATGSMGDDTPMAVLSRQERSLFDFFRQLFAQVTNPPIDPIREERVMSLRTCFGRESNPFEPSPQGAKGLEIPSPVLSRGQFEALLSRPEAEYRCKRLFLSHSPTESLADAVDRLSRQAIAAVRAGNVLLVLSDREISRETLPVHSLLAVGAIHHALIEVGLRCEANLILETATLRDAHHLAVLLGYGATAVYPYLAYQTLLTLAEKKQPQHSLTPSALLSNYRKGLEKGLYKIISKMGISSVNAYRGSQLFEAVGLHDSVIERCFVGTVSRLQGATFDDLDAMQRALSREAWHPAKPLRLGGLLKFTANGEAHAFEPDVVMALQKAVQTADWDDYQEFADRVNQRDPLALRDLLGLRLAEQPTPLEAVEPAVDILRRFNGAAMSLGSLSPEAHEALAIAMNRLGARSNSGEGGEDPARYDTEKVSRIKQVASGRFGVTPAYLIHADVLQIKMAQGAKPGEGGQLPGPKVNGLIARLRYTTPGTSLISPPPHHDIYSIEDLAQLVFDLKQANPQALVSVKLVSEPGVGTVAAGVAKTYADWITIAGYDGGTGASPLSSIRYAGLPWELGLSEAHQVLRANGLRGRVRLEADGGLKTGLDVVKAAILGAEFFTFGTVPLVALGCKYLRICHLNTCATGVATQNEILRAHHFQGAPERVETYFRFVAEEVRLWLARLGVTRLEQVIGRLDLLTQLPGSTLRHQHLDLSALLKEPAAAFGQSHTCQQPRNPSHDRGELAERMVSDTLPAISQKTGGLFSYPIRNTDRSIGARVSGEIARRHGDQGMEHAPLVIQFRGVAGQSFGAWNAGGLHLHLEGDANDYVGKGMAGGKIVLLPDRTSRFIAKDTPIMGNTCLYGATGGRLYAAGQAGQRFAVRNSGAIAVVEGLGNHGCEYMTGGIVAVLGEVGHNFAAGMTGGLAYVLDEHEQLVLRLNPELVQAYPLSDPSLSAYQQELRQLLTEHVQATHSRWGQTLLEQWSRWLPVFRLVAPKTVELSLSPGYIGQMA
jgi:glutamate synthase (NADPH/NADH) large chain